jgi:uncharacterized protein DUF1501
MDAKYACKSGEHVVARRQFLGAMAAAGAGACVGGLGVFTTPVIADQLRSDQKRIVVFNMAGGLSQLESWDPKPGTATGGPFRSIATSVPGIRISELLPETAKQMHHLCLVRGVNTSEDDHGKGAYLMLHGRRQTPAGEYPEIGAVAAKALAPTESPLPGYVLITPGGGGGRGNDAAYLGPKYSSVQLGNGKPPQNTVRPQNVSELSETSRQAFRKRVNDEFLSRRRTAITEAFTYSFEQAEQLMRQRDVFDVSKEPEKDVNRYGKHDFGRHCLLARRLLEKGITCVQLSHSNYDTHNENFNFHIEQLGEFDRSFANFVADIADRGMLDSTLIVVLSEFGRTPGINPHMGRDHWSKSWSICMGGGRVPRGHVYGKTSADGKAVEDGQVDHGALFHTYLEAVGVDSTGSFVIDGRKMPIADPAAAAVSELLT